MSTLKANNIQIGQSATASQNFVLAVPATPDGTIKLARGSAGATTQDVLTIDADGNVGLAPDDQLIAYLQAVALSF